MTTNKPAKQDSSQSGECTNDKTKKECPDPSSHVRGEETNCDPSR